jgi:ParB/RepB/Spo0J family partition protein
MNNGSDSGKGGIRTEEATVQTTRKKAKRAVRAKGDREKAPIQFLPIGKLRPNDYNPNRMTEEEFAELLAEVRHLGRLPKPVVVRQDAQGYVIVDGEHGWRAATEAGLLEIPCEVLDADDFEAMRQTYKRNQHGTHNPVLLGRMFRRMMAERDLSARALAKEICVSEGTVRNAVLYAEAADLRNRYAPEDGTDDQISRLTVRQVRCYLQLPPRIGQLWFDGRCDLKALYQVKSEAEVEFAENNLALEPVSHNFRCLEETGLLEFIGRVYSPSGFAAAIKKVEKWAAWERDWLRYGFERDAFRSYSRYYFKENWCVRDHHMMDSVLEVVVDSHAEPPAFLLTPEEFVTVLELCNLEGASAGSFRERLQLAVITKVGHLPQSDTWAKRELLEKLLRDAPGYIQESLLCPEDKYALWQAQGPEEAKRGIASLKRLPLVGDEKKDLRTSSEKCIHRLVRQWEWEQHVRARWEAKSEQELAQEIANRFIIYDPQTDSQAIEILAGKLRALTKSELAFLAEYASGLESHRALANFLRTLA